VTPDSKSLAKGKWLFIGGAGYIGSHVLREFYAAGAECFVLDNLVTGKTTRLPHDVSFIHSDATNPLEIINACNQHRISGIVHLAAYMQARESVRDPIKYWTNNLGSSLALAAILPKTKVEQVIFSSSCSVYGDAGMVTETSPIKPISPYAMTKVASEEVLVQVARVCGIQLNILRYFNVIGCGSFPESYDHSEETILPAVSRLILAGKAPIIFGDDFDTPDGSPIRDYLDVRDLARAHLIVAKTEMPQKKMVLNVSTGRPVSVKEVIRILLEVASSELIPVIRPARPGDPAAIWSNESHHLRSFGWSPQYSLRESIHDFWHASTSFNK
jgi:UDP-glucose 4-epimerase